MKMPPLRNLLLAMLGMTGASLGVSGASAALLIEESFAYTVGGSLTSQNGGTGFSDAWSTGSGTAGSVVNGLSFSGLQTSGGAARVSGVGTTTTFLNRTISASFSGDTIWGSYLFSAIDQPQINTGAGGSTWDIRFRNQGSEGTSEYRVMPFLGSTTTRNMPGVGYGSSAFAFPASVPDIYNGSSFLFLSRITGLGTASETLNLWILDEAGLAAARSLGLTDAALAANLVANGFISLTYNNTMSITSGDVLQLANYANTGTRSYIVDELRYGTTALDVLPVPEPGSVLLIGLAGIAFATWRNRKGSLCRN